MNTPEDLEWSTEQRKINDLKAYGRNPRKLTDEQKKHLTERGVWVGREI